MKILGIVGSPRKDKGLTDALVQKALDGASTVGAQADVMYLMDREPQPCIHCGGGCFQTHKCAVEEDAARRSQEVYESDAIILGAPVYIWQINGLTANFIDKLRLQDATPPCRTTNARPALGISVAGGTGSGLISAIQSIYKFFCLWGFYAIEPLPVTRHNFESALQTAWNQGKLLAELAEGKRNFEDIGSCLAHYAKLPLLRFDTVDEMLYLSQIITDNTTVNDANRQTYNNAIEHQRTAKALIADGNRIEAAHHAGRAYEFAREAYDG
ncbi:TPA: flavodoxin family protein [Candidatus Poribacteria bacterium]|nr:flavodoxin family protein [Candidatus Poribacteria bacterium]